MGSQRSVLGSTSLEHAVRNLFSGLSPDLLALHIVDAIAPYFREGGRRWREAYERGIPLAHYTHEPTVLVVSFRGAADSTLSSAAEYWEQFAGLIPARFEEAGLAELADICLAQPVSDPYADFIQPFLIAPAGKFSYEGKRQFYFVPDTSGMIPFAGDMGDPHQRYLVLYEQKFMHVDSSTAPGSWRI